MINNKDFLKFMQEKEIMNLSFIKAIQFNDKSITVKIQDKQFFFNNLFNENSLYNMIISYLILYVKANKIDYPTDKDFLKAKFKKLNIREVRQWKKNLFYFY